jgi:hypothetical protein
MNTTITTKEKKLKKRLILTFEDEQYFRDNFKIINNKILAKKFGVSTKTIQKTLIRLNLKREKSDIRLIIINSNVNNIANQSHRRTIEGGGRKEHRARYHKNRWSKINGAIPKGYMLVYNTKKYEDFNDLILIKQKSFDSFIKKRETRLNKLKKEKKSQEIHDKKLSSEKLEMDRENIVKFIQEQGGHSIENEFKNNKVPIKLDKNTTIFVKREKCEKLEDGSYVLKKGETTKTKSFFQNKF